MAGITLLDFFDFSFLAPKFVIRHFLKNRYIAGLTLLDFFDFIFSVESSPRHHFLKNRYMAGRNVARFFLTLGFSRQNF